MLQETVTKPTMHLREPKSETWLRESWRQLYRFLYIRVQNREEAEDLAQETFSKALAHGGAPSQEYLFTTALNLIRDRWRRKQTRGTTLALDEAILLQPDQQDEAVRKAWIQSLMARLPANYRLVLDLRIVQGYSRAEVAARMGRSEQAVANLQYRAVQALRDMMREQLKEER